MQGHWYDGFAQVEANLARLGIVVGSYDNCEIREVAAMLGANSPDAAGDGEVDMSEFLAGGA